MTQEESKPPLTLSNAVQEESKQLLTLPDAAKDYLNCSSRFF